MCLFRKDGFAGETVNYKKVSPVVGKIVCVSVFLRVCVFGVCVSLFVCLILFFVCLFVCLFVVLQARSAPPLFFGPKDNAR